MTDFKGFAISSQATEKPVVWDADHPDHRRAFATAIAPLVAVLWKRKEPFARPEAMTYMRTLKYVPSSILVAAVERSLEAETWFPEPAKLLEYAALIQSERRRIASAPLAQCEHPSHWIENADGQQVRCACWIATRQAMSEIGEPLVAKRLPAMREPEAEI